MTEQTPNPPPDGIYLIAVRKRLERDGERLHTRLARMAGKPTSRDAASLWFHFHWNGRHNFTVAVDTRDDQEGIVSESAPYGHLWAVDAPEARAEDPRAFAAEKPSIVEQVADALAARWMAAGGAEYPLPVFFFVADSSDVREMTSEAPLDLRRLDPREVRWIPDERAQRRGQVNAELREQVRARLADLRPQLLEKLSAITAHPPPPGATGLRCGVDVNCENTVPQLMAVFRFEPDSQNHRLLSGTRLPRGASVKWETFVGRGADVERSVRDELLHLLCEVWEEAGGLEYPQAPRTWYEYGEAEYDLSRRRWVVDYWGRSLE